MTAGADPVQKRLVIGVDSSTSATKVIAFDDTGAVVSHASEPHSTYSDRPGFREQDAHAWWDAFSNAAKRVTAEVGKKGFRLDGIAFTHQRFTFVPVDAEFRPLRRGILWNDLRCTGEAEFARSSIGAEKIFSRTGYPPGQWTLYKALWLMRNEPEVYDRTRWLALVPDFLVYRLTGSIATSESSAAMTGALDIVRRDRWATDIITELGLRDKTWIEPILPGAAEIGRVSRDGRRETGLPLGLPVFAAAGDQPCGSLGAGVRHPGDLGINGGTSCSSEFVVGALPELIRPDYFIEISPTGEYIVENDVPAGGSFVMNWFRTHFGARDLAVAEREGVDPWDVIYGHLKSTPPGNDGYMIVPYLQGTYGPYWDQNARSVSIGMRTEHGRPHLARALIEGVAYEARREVEMMELSTEASVREIHMYGGSARSDLWNQLFSDMFSKPLVCPETADTTALGAAMCAAVGCGWFGGFSDAVDAMVTLRKRYTPNDENAAIYDRFYNNVYTLLYDRVSDLVAVVAAAAKTGDAAQTRKKPS